MRRKRWLNLASGFYVGLICVWFGVRAISFDQLWWMLLLNSVAVYLFLPLLPLLTWAVLCRHPQLLLTLAPAILIFGVLFGRQFAPGGLTAPAQPLGRPITVMTFNVLYTNRDFTALVAAIRAARPDVVGFQELTPKISQAILDALAVEYPYHTLTSREQMSGVALISRFPIERRAPFPLPPRNLALHAVLNVGGAPLHVLVAHLQPSRLGVAPDLIPAAAATFYATRVGEVAAIEREIGGVQAPLLLLCDCNMPDTSEGHAQLAAHLADSFSEVGWGFGHTSHYAPLPFATQRLDYIWHSAGITALAADRGQPGGSDHFPVVARLSIHSSNQLR